MGIGNAFYGVANLLINRGGLYPDKFYVVPLIENRQSLPTNQWSRFICCGESGSSRGISHSDMAFQVV